MTISITFDHTGFITPDLEGSLRFWSETMGFDPKPVVERKGDWVPGLTGVPGAQLKLVHLFGHDTHIELIEFLAAAGSSETPAANQAGAGHICLKVSDVEAMRDKIVAAGGRAIGAVTTVTEGPLAGNLRGLYMADPYGVLIELLQSN